MVSVATSLGVERTQARNEMKQILNLEKSLANVGESFVYVHMRLRYKYFLVKKF
jgi:hypothetical protein